MTISCNFNDNIYDSNINFTKYVYSATGQKLRAVHYTAPANIHVSAGNDYDIEHSYLAADSTDYLLGGSVTFTNDRFSKILFDGGYISNDGYVHALNAKPNDFLWQDEEDSLDQAKEWPFSVDDDEELVFRFYVKDHFGNNRMVIDSDGNVLQRTDYYPFGMPFYEPSNADNSALQQYKYNGKELDKMHGLNTYDYGARQYNPITARWDRPDPLAEKYYGVSPYVYCAGNPINYIDQDGRDWILSTGDKVYWYGGDVGDNSQLLYTFNATSGNIVERNDGGFNDYQEAKYQNLRDKGPTPEGDYHINLEPNPERIANANLQTGNLLRNPDGGIEKIPESVQIPNNPGYYWTYEAWGKNRAALTPDNVTGAKDSERDNSSYYFHDSAKGYTHGCTEVDPVLFQHLNDYRNAGNSRIDVVIKYGNPNHKTNGGTKK